MQTKVDNFNFPSLNREGGREDGPDVERHRHSRQVKSEVKRLERLQYIVDREDELEVVS